MGFWQWIDGGSTYIGTGKTVGERFALWCGLRLARLRPNVFVDDTCRISPEVRISARGGKIELGPKCAISPYAGIQGPVRMGTNCSLGTHSLLVAYKNGEITLGDNVRIGPYVMAIGSNHVFRDRNRPICEQGSQAAPIVIEDDVWIGGHVSITAGVRIGTGSVIGAGAVVTKDIPPYSIAAGVPARVIRTRD